ncbi:MAG: hypothetical protein K9M03_02410 [Kiritimatiellales bacterium]|nr:hypothetical protein [Kiritimatiellales bacterium]
MDENELEIGIGNFPEEEQKKARQCPILAEEKALQATIENGIVNIQCEYSKRACHVGVLCEHMSGPDKCALRNSSVIIDERSFKATTVNPKPKNKSDSHGTYRTSDGSLNGLV